MTGSPLSLSGAFRLRAMRPFSVDRGRWHHDSWFLSRFFFPLLTEICLRFGTVQFSVYVLEPLSSSFECFRFPKWMFILYLIWGTGFLLLGYEFPLGFSDATRTPTPGNPSLKPAGFQYPCQSLKPRPKPWLGLPDIWDVKYLFVCYASSMYLSTSRRLFWCTKDCLDQPSVVTLWRNLGKGEEVPDSK